MTGAPTAAAGPNDWIGTAEGVLRRGGTAVLATIVHHLGSSPREKGCWMLVTEDLSYGSIGGGEMERTVEAASRDMLAGRADRRRVDLDYLLGPDLGQCCGGAVNVLLQPIAAGDEDWLAEAAAASANGAGYVMFSRLDSDTKPRVMSGDIPENIFETESVHIQPLADTRPIIVIYGAGHVGRAVASMAAQLPVRMEVVDERTEALDAVPPAANVAATLFADPPSHARSVPTGAAVLVLTHSHALDYRLVRTLVTRGDLAYLGLIGSRTKGARFRNRLTREGFDDVEIARLTSPIGADGPAGKEPGVIALAVLTEIVGILRAAADHRHANERRTGM